jgi:hypothetical protein
MESYADTATKERLVIMDDNGKVIKDVGGTKGAVVWSGNDIPNNKGQYTFIHNHPASESHLPSQSDLTLGARVGGKHIVTSPKATIEMDFGKPGSVKLSKRGEDPASKYRDSLQNVGSMRGNKMASDALKSAGKEYGFDVKIKNR